MLPMEHIPSFRNRHPLGKETKLKLSELLPLKVYSFTLRFNTCCIARQRNVINAPLSVETSGFICFADKEKI